MDTRIGKSDIQLLPSRLQVQRALARLSDNELAELIDLIQSKIGRHVDPTIPIARRRPVQREKRRYVRPK